MNTAEKRRCCAAALETTMKELAQRQGVVISDCDWEFCEDSAQPILHRLNVRVQDAVIKIYFTDLELLSFEDEHKSFATQARLNELFQELTEEQFFPEPLHALSYVPEQTRH